MQRKLDVYQHCSGVKQQVAHYVTALRILWMAPKHKVLNSGEPVTKGRLVAFSPFLDVINVIRVGGRLKDSNMVNDTQ